MDYEVSLLRKRIKIVKPKASAKTDDAQKKRRRMKKQAVKEEPVAHADNLDNDNVNENGVEVKNEGPPEKKSVVRPWNFDNRLTENEKVAAAWLKRTDAVFGMCVCPLI
jgi:hypothetical protein